MNTQQPVLLCIAGFDPTGGAGLQADIETAAMLGVRTVCAQTCNTVQDSAGTYAVAATDPAMLKRQIERLIADFNIAAVKVGLVASADNAWVIAEGMARLACPLVADPVLYDGTGIPLCDDGTAQAIRSWLLPAASCATPNRKELAALVPEAAATADAARALLDEGCGAVLVTDEESKEQALQSALYSPDRKRRVFESPRLTGEFHGSGCTLSSAVAAHLALDRPLNEAVSTAFAFTRNALESASEPGTHPHARKFPNRQ